VISLSTVLAGACGLILCVVGGVAYGWWTERQAARSGRAAQEGRPVTVPVLVAVEGVQSRSRLVPDGDDLRVIGPGHHLLVGRDEYDAADVRRTRFDEKRFEAADQRAFVSASGVRYLVGPVDEWAPALYAPRQSAARPAARWRVLRAAMPRTPVALTLLAVTALATFQVVWAMGHDVQASFVKVVGDEGLEMCVVQWPQGGRVERAGVDCYPPFPQAGESLPVRALGWPFRGEAMDREDTYPMATTLLGGAVVLLAGIGLTVGLRRLRTPPVRLHAVPATAVVVRKPDTVLSVGSDASLLELLDAVTQREGWDGDAVGAAPRQPWYAPYLMALGAGRWWPVPVLGGVALLVERVPEPWRWALGAGALVALGWALVRAIDAWLAIRRSRSGPVTSEWDYRLVRSFEDEWAALLVLGSSPRWLVVLDGPGHPALSGRCGVRGDLRDGGAITLRLGEQFWPTTSPVMRVDEGLLADLRDDLLDRLSSSTPHRREDSVECQEGGACPETCPCRCEPGPHGSPLE
jgi:hypothetical protein